MSENESSLIYSIDKLNNIVYVNGEWDRFALANDGHEFTGSKVLNRSFWDFVSGETLRQLYFSIFRQVRAGKILQFDFRCDSPDLRRFLNVRITSTRDSSVWFETTTIKTEEREASALFKRRPMPTEGPVIVCSWCNKVKIGGNLWVEAEKAVKALSFFEKDAVPQLSHGICTHCYDDITAGIAKKSVL
jgi:hypothetical protein